MSNQVRQISKILVANRGEIAVRILDAIHQLGLSSVAVYSDADRSAKHVQMADQAVYLGPSSAQESYLKIEAVLSAAQVSGADAIHPGYGFLAENAHFARACHAAGLIFIGPDAECIEQMGSKIQARQAVEALGLPVIPAKILTQPIQQAELLAAAAALTYPLLIKASAGGGGRGMRLVKHENELITALVSAQSEALQAFGDDSVYLEQYLPEVRHIEFQILGDSHGNLLHLFERECSLQRRYQKVIEEAPSPSLTPGLRQAMAAAALKIGKSLNYSNAGTVEFVLVPDTQQFYFLEVNSRLQVEHPVTEAITGIDLVQWQIRIAQGQALPWLQEQVQVTGHAIECRLNAEDPLQDYLPDTGTILYWQAPPTIRSDSGIQTGSEVSIFYDAMLAKLISHGRDRSEAIQKMQRALSQTILFGLQSNLAHLQSLLATADFRENQIHTHWLSQHPPQKRNYSESDLAQILTLVWASLYQQQEHDRQKNGDLPSIPSGWRNNTAALPEQKLIWDEQSYRLRAQRLGSEQFQLAIFADDLGPISHHQIQIFPQHNKNAGTRHFSCEIDGIIRNYTSLLTESGVYLQQAEWGQTFVQKPARLPVASQTQTTPGAYCATMPAKILRCLVSEGQAVEIDQPLLVMESMKMETTLIAHTAGLVSALWVSPGDLVEAKRELLQITAKSTDSSG